MINYHFRMLCHGHLMGHQYYYLLLPPLQYLPVYVPSELEKQDPLLYANNVRKLMAKCENEKDHMNHIIRLVGSIFLPRRKWRGLDDQNRVVMSGMRSGEVVGELEKFSSASTTIDRVESGCLDVPVLNCAYADHPVILKTLRNHFPIEPHLRCVQALRMEMKFGSPRSELSKYTEFTRTREDKVSLQKFSDYLLVTTSSENIQKLFSLYKTNEAMDTTGRLELSSEQLEKILSRTFNLSSSESLNIFESIDVDKKGFVTYDDLTTFTKKKSFFYKLFIGFGDIASDCEQNELLHDSPEVFYHHHAVPSPIRSKVNLKLDHEDFKRVLLSTKHELDLEIPLVISSIHLEILFPYAISFFYMIFSVNIDRDVYEEDKLMSSVGKLLYVFIHKVEFTPLDSNNYIQLPYLESNNDFNSYAVCTSDKAIVDGTVADSVCEGPADGAEAAP
ncbi:hypothetical protein GQR58_022490 [Nymphon striatum]|nr:hypothetical protein GQR58_022490 [Nymphon striatum]